MINIPSYTENDLNVFENKQIVIYGCGQNANELYNVLTSLKFNVLGFCCKKKRFKKFRNMKNIYNIKDVKDMIKKNMEIIIQDANVQGCIYNFFPQHVVSKLVTEKIIYSFRNKLILSRGDKVIDFIKNRYLVSSENELKSCKNNIKASRKKNLILICNPTKTADHTLNYTFDKINGKRAYSYLKIQEIAKCLLVKKYVSFLGSGLAIVNNAVHSKEKINYINLFHKPIAFEKKLYAKNKVRIITAVREPISQNMSYMFQIFGASYGSYDYWINCISGKDNCNVDRRVWRECNELFVSNGDNAQVLFNHYINDIVYPDEIPDEYKVYPISRFIKYFNMCITNLYAHSFDKERGYSIIKDGNIEVFVYQLEKLNKIVPKLSEWIGVPFEKLENGNITTDKWIGGSYKQAQKEIEISQEYFERCFDEKYVKHFYSEEDIKKFKEKWRPHIKQ